TLNVPKHCRTSRRQYLEWAFTLIELLVVIAIIDPGRLLLPALSKAKAKAAGVYVLNNNKQLALGHFMFADENNDDLPGNLDGGGVSTLSNSNKTWVLGWIDLNAGSDSAFPARSEEHTSELQSRLHLV